MRTFVCASVLILLPPAVTAQEGGLELFTGGTIFAHGTRVSLNSIWRDKERLRQGTRHVDDPMQRRFTEFREVLTIDHGLRRDVMLTVLLPFVWRESKSAGQHLAAEGIGDLALFGKVQLHRTDWPQGAFAVAAAGGVELPTGATGERDAGMRLAPTLQPGSGAFSPFASLATTWEQGRWRADASVFHKWNMEGAQDYEAGDFFSVGVSAAYRFWFEKFPGPSAKFTLGVLYRHEGRAESMGVRLTDSGADQWLLRPALTWHPDPRWDVALAAEMPLFQDMNGSQLGRDLGLTLHVGFRF